ncbi:MAG: hypothetical protein ACREUQ_08625 [Burkholderiales bacterium]
MREGLQSTGVPQQALAQMAEATPKDHCHATKARAASVGHYDAILQQSPA